MKKNFRDENWREYIPVPVCEEFPEYESFYNKAWELAHTHVRDIPGMPQNPYMDEAFCDTQVWIWDTCFMSLFCKFAQGSFPGVETFNNFYEVLHAGNLLPEIVPGENEPWWTGATPGVATNIKVHIADNPPLFAWGEYENALIHGEKEHISKLLYESRALQHHYEWIEGLKEKIFLKGVLLNTNLIHEEFGYTWEGGSSGMDNTPRGRKEIPSAERPNNPDMLWIDAICQQALSAKMIAKLFDILEDKENEAEWLAKFNEKKDIINKYYWNDEDKIYYDVDRRDMSQFKVITPASFWALTAGVATEKQAAQMVKLVEDPLVLGGDPPLTSLARNDAEFDTTGRYWRGSVWMPTAYAALKGIAEYKRYDIAHDAGYKIFKHMLATYNEYEPHTIWECYSPTKPMPATVPAHDGENIVRPDFCGWSALGPISIYIEYVLGFHTINAFENRVEWEMPTCFKGNIGVKNLRFGDVVTDIISDGKTCAVKSNAPYTLAVCGKEYAIGEGETNITI